MNIKHVAAIAAIAIGSFCGVSGAYAMGAGYVVVDPNSIPGFIPKPLPHEAEVPRVMVVQAGDWVFCTKTTNILPLVANVGVFTSDTSGTKLCINVEDYPLTYMVIE